MVHAAEDAARFLHHACRGLPDCLNGEHGSGNELPRRSGIDEFYARTIEHAVAYFGSRVLDPSRPTPAVEDAGQLSRAACEKAAQTAARSDKSKLEASARELGSRIGSQIYDAYLSGKVAPSGLRRLFLARLHEPGMARKVCTAVIAKLCSLSRSARS
jgi:hypothetical protein